MKRIISIILSLAIIFSTPIFTNATASEEKILSKFNPITKPIFDFALIKQYVGDKIVIYTSNNTYNDSNFYKYGLINLKGEVILKPKYKYIDINNNGDIKVYNKSTKEYNIYDKHMVPIGGGSDTTNIDCGLYFPKYSNEIDENKIFTYDNYESIITIENKLSGQTKTIPIVQSKFDNQGYLNVLRYCKEIKAFDCLCTPGADSGMINYYYLSCFDLNGNNIFENDLGVKVYAYIGDGYYFYEQNGKKGIALLPGFKEKTVVKTLKKPSSTKIKKIWKKKKSSKKLKVCIGKVKEVSYYQIKIYSSKKNAKKNKKALVSKKTKKTTVTLKSKKLANKKPLYVRVRAINQISYSYKCSKWSTIKKVKIK